MDPCSVAAATLGAGFIAWDVSVVAMLIWDRTFEMALAAVETGSH